MEAKNYFKALDYQGITFKVNDKRKISTKHLITEIEERRLQQQEDYQAQIQKVDTSSALLVPARRPPQFTFDFGKKDVIKDVIRLVYYFFERTELYSAENQDKMRTFMETLLPLVLDIGSVISDDQNDDDDDGNGVTAMDEGGDESMGMEDDGDEEGDDDEAADEADDEEDEESQSVQSYDTDDDAGGNSSKSPRSMTRGSAKKNNGNRRTLKDILTENIRQQSTPAPPPALSTSTTGADAAADTDATLPSDSENDTTSRPSQQIPQETDVDVPEASDKPETSATQASATEGGIASPSKADQESTSKDSTANKRHVYNLFGDSEFYCFFRLYQVGKKKKVEREDVGMDERNIY